MKRIKLLFFFAFLLAAKITTAAESEPNNTRAQANTLTLNGSNSGAIGNATDVDWYKLTTNADGRIDLTLTVSNSLYAWVTLYDNDGNTLITQNYTAGTLNLSADGLAAGTYYLKIYPYYAGELPKYTIANTLVTPAEPNDAEPDSTRAQALVLPLNGSKKGHINYYYNNHRDSLDVYKVTLTGDGALKLTLSVPNGKYVWFELDDNDAKTLLNRTYTASTANFTFDGLAAGTYYIKIYTYYTYDFAPYTLSNTFTAPTQANDAEPDSTLAQAIPFNPNNKKTGHVGYYYNNHRDTIDVYKITTNTDGNLKISLTSANSEYVYFSLYDTDGNTLIQSTYTSGSASYNADGLAAGVYYLKIYCYYNNKFAPYTITDTLTTYNANDAEPNKYAKQASTLLANQVNNGHIGFYNKKVRDTTDWYKINYTGNGPLSVSLSVLATVTQAGSYTYMQIYKDTNAAPIYNNYSYTALNANLTNLAQGYYYVKVFEYYNYNFTPYTLTPTFTQTNVAGIKPTAYDTAAVCASTNSITYSCSKSKGPYTIQLYRFGVAYGSPVTTNKKYTFTNLPVGSYYATAFGDGATGTAFGKSRSTSIEPIPVNLRTTNILATQAKLNWNAVACADYFTIQYKLASATTWTNKKTNGNVNTYTLTGLTANRKYNWRVASVNSSNSIISTGEYADSISFTTAAALIAGEENTSEDLSANNSKLNTGIITVSPNPASSYFVIQSMTANGKVTAQLKDLSGKIQWTSGAVAGSNLAGMRVNVSNLAAGVYILELINDKGSLHATTKVMVVK